MARKLIVEIVGDDRRLQSTYKGATTSTSKFGGALGKLGKVAGATGLALGGVLAIGLKKSIDSANEHAKVYAQTNAVLKSTGRTAGVSAKQVAKFADATEKLTGIDDIAVQKGENLLLTFTNIQNKVGKGNDIFRQASKAIVDMSVALGQDTTSSAIQLGKALNDPIKGVTALRRVGVSFTKSQLDQIKALVKAGKTTKAQQLILRELNKEFGGSAKAFGRTLPGQIAIFKARLDDVAQTIGQKLIPVLAKGLKILSDLLAIFQGGGSASSKFQKALERLGVSAETSRRVIADFGEAIHDMQVIFTKAFQIMRPILQAFGEQVRAIVQLLDDLIHGRWSKLWGDAAQVVVKTVGLWKTVLEQAVKTLGGIALRIGKAIVTGIVTGLANLGKRLIAAIVTPVQRAVEKVKSILDSLNLLPGGGSALDPKNPILRGAKGKNQGASVHVSPSVGSRSLASVTVSGGGGLSINGPITVVANNPEEFLRQLQKKARTKSASRTGRFGGHNLGLA